MNYISWNKKGSLDVICKVIIYDRETKIHTTVITAFLDVDVWRIIGCRLC